MKKPALRLIPLLGLCSVALAADGTQPLARDLWKQLGKSNENVIYSPASIAGCLELARAGARGATKDELDKVLHGTPAKLVHDGVKVSNHVWGQKGLAFKPEFKVDAVDFENQPDSARRTINDTIAKETKDRIKDLLPPSAITKAVRLVLTNAIHLDAKWRKPFETHATYKQPFHLADGSKIDVRTMHGRIHEAARHGKKDGLEVAEIPYKGTLVFDVIVPRDVTKYELDLDAALALLEDVRELDVALPSFELTQEIALKDALIAIGLETAFTAKADLSGFTGEKGLFFSEAVTKTYIRVDEEGTEAAAATAMVAVGSAAPREAPSIKVDRPFFFAIRETTTGSVAFFGKVGRPIEPQRSK